MTIPDAEREHVLAALHETGYWNVSSNCFHSARGGLAPLYWPPTVTVSGSLAAAAPLSSVARAENTYRPAGLRTSTV